MKYSDCQEENYIFSENRKKKKKGMLILTYLVKKN